RELGFSDEETEDVSRRAVRHLHAARMRASRRGDRSAAAGLIDRELRLRAPDDPARIRLMTDLAALLRWLGDLPRATQLLDEAVRMARRSGDQLAEGHALLERFEVAIMRANEDVSESSAEVERLLPIFEAAGDHRGVARAMRTISVIEWMACRFDR